MCFLRSDQHKISWPIAWIPFRVTAPWKQIIKWSGPEKPSVDSAELLASVGSSLLKEGGQWAVGEQGKVVPGTRASRDEWAPCGLLNKSLLLRMVQVTCTYSPYIPLTVLASSHHVYYWLTCCVANWLTNGLWCPFIPLLKASYLCGVWVLLGRTGPACV